MFTFVVSPLRVNSSQVNIQVVLCTEGRLAKGARVVSPVLVYDALMFPHISGVAESLVTKLALIVLPRLVNGLNVLIQMLSSSEL